MWVYEGQNTKKEISDWFENKKKTINNNIIILPTKYNDEWGDIEPLVSKKLRYLDEEQEFTINEDTKNVILLYPFQKQLMQKIYYHIILTCDLSIYASTYLQNFVDKLKNTGILKYGLLHIITNEKLSLYDNDNQIIVQTCLNEINYESLLYTYTIIQTNQHDDYLLYIKLNENQNIFNNLVEKWEKCLFIFQHFLSISKIGLFTNDHGKLYLNQGWYRISFLKQLEKPNDNDWFYKKDNENYYYDVWNLISDNDHCNIGSYKSSTI